MSIETLQLSAASAVQLPAEAMQPVANPYEFQPRGVETMGAIGEITLGGNGEKADANYNYKMKNPYTSEQVLFD